VSREEEPLQSQAELEDFCQVDTPDGVEAFLALTSHRHLVELGEARHRLALGHARLHALQALMPEEDWEQVHTECVEDALTLEEWITRGRAAIWS
jgi:hypothetical protein